MSKADRTKTLKMVAAVAALAVVFLSASACSHIMMMRGVRKPAATEFGLGPRTSAEGRYSATIEAPGTLKPRKMYSFEVTVTDAQGAAIDGAAITVDGGMPEHGHGLPTRPRVTRNLGGGRYLVEGVRFNMGGWWEFKLAISTPSGTDNVTFNLEV